MCVYLALNENELPLLKSTQVAVVSIPTTIGLFFHSRHFDLSSVGKAQVLLKT